MCIHSTVTHQAKQAANFVNGPQAAKEAHDHGEGPNSNQCVAGHLNRAGAV